MNAPTPFRAGLPCLLALALVSEAIAAGPPRIDAISWPAETPLEEGRTVLLRLTGENLTPDLVPAFVEQTGGAASGVFTFSQWTANGSTAGVRFHIPVMPSVGAGAVVQGAIELIAPNGPGAAVAVTIAGLDEFHLVTGETLEIVNRSEQRFSEIRVDAGAVIRVEAGGTIDWQSTGPVVIDGLIDAKGRDGTPAIGGLGGSVFGRQGGSGGDGGLLAGNVPPEPGGDGDHPLPARRIAVSGGFGFIEPASAGGLVGHNNGAVALESCTDLEAAPCSFAINALFDYALLPDDQNFTKLLLAGAQGWSGVGVDTNLARPRPGYAGGGGGGSGARSAGDGLPDLDGGGGGQGGEGGRGVRILGGSTMTLNNLVTTDGGRGGDGARADQFLSDPPTLADLTLSGGGGGGGAAGELILGSRGAFQRLAGVTTTSSGGGVAGQGGVLLYDASDIREEPWVERGVERVTRGRQSLFSAIGFQGGPVFTPTVWEDLVTSATFLDVLDVANTHSIVPGSIEIRGEQPGQLRVVPVVGATNSTGQLSAPYRAMLVLFPGFNTIIARPADGEDAIDDPAYALLFRRVFTLGGTDVCDAACQAVLANPYVEDGIVRYIAGDGIFHNHTYLVDGAPALTTALRADSPARIAFGPDGRLYFAQRGTNTPPWGTSIAIRRLEPDGTLTTLVGAGTNFGNDIHVSELALNQELEAIAVGPDGSIYLHERAFTPLAPQRIRKIGTDGVIHTVVGGGTDAFFSTTPVPATSVDLDVFDGYDMAVDATGILYLSRRLSRVTPIAFPPFYRTNLVGAISRVTPDGMLRNIIGGHFLSGPGQGGGLDEQEWEGQPALAAGAFPQALAVSPDGQQIYFHTAAANRWVLVRADLNPFNSTPEEPRYVLHNLTTNVINWSEINDNVPARETSFREAWDMSLAPDGCLFIGGRSIIAGGGSAGTIHKIAPNGISYLVYGGPGAQLEPTNSQPARFHGSYAVGYSDVKVGPDNRVVFFPRSSGEARLAKIVQPHDALPPFAPPPSVSFGTATMVVLEANALLQIPLSRQGYAGYVYVVINRSPSPDVSGTVNFQVTFDIEETNEIAQFNLVNNSAVDGTRTVEFTVQFAPPGWTPPPTDPGMQAVLGPPDRMTLVILDDDSPLPQPLLLPPLLLDNGLMRLESLGAPNRDYILQSSFDLLDWDDAQTNQSPLGLLLFQVDRTIEQQFFRLRH